MHHKAERQDPADGQFDHPPGLVFLRVTELRDFDYAVVRLLSTPLVSELMLLPSNL